MAIKFIKTAINDFRVGAIARSSRYVIRRVLGFLGHPVNSVLEYGPGDGALTRALLDVLSPEGRLIAIEPNEDFVRMLREIHDPRMDVVYATAQEAESVIKATSNVDVVVSSMPFSLLSREERSRFVEDAYRALSSRGRLIVFHQYTTVMVSLLKKHFAKTRVYFEFRNIFPCLIIVAEK
ncbi:MAG: methyltransferase domain-containing protein [Patescibacteria group bacterium]